MRKPWVGRNSEVGKELSINGNRQKMKKRKRKYGVCKASSSKKKRRALGGRSMKNRRDSTF